MPMVRPKSVVVIGGGIAGASITRVLSKAGVKVTLLEKSNMLCSGATWHAAGLVTRFASSSKLKKVHVRSMQLLNEVHDEFGINLHLAGSIRIIEKGNADRLREAHQHVAMADLFDDKEYPTEMISAERVAELHPLLDPSMVECGVWTPHDGDVDPTLLTNAVAKQARGYGAKILINQHVTGVDSRIGGGFVVKVENGEALECDAVVNAAGLWSRHVTDMAPVGAATALHHPAFVLEHHYAVTETIPEVEALAKAGHNGGRLPVLRDLRGSSYIRQEGNGFLIGPYEEDCIVRTDMPRGPPASFSMELFPDKLERIEENLMKGMELVPCLGDVGFKSVVNGPTIWTGDSMPRCGRSALPGWYDFNSLSYGIAQSLPLAEYLGHIMLEGEQPQAFDASDAFDPLRYGAWADDAFAVNKIKESYAHNNKIVYNYENRSAGRGELVTEKGGSSYPLHDVLAAQGARFAPFGGAGCEIPLCYVGANENDVDFHDQKRFSHFEWAKYAEAEAQHALAKVAISYSSFSKLIVTGADSKAFMENVTTGVLPSVPAKELESGKCAPGDMASRLTYCTTPLGNVCTEFTIAKLDDVGQKWYMVGSRDHVRQDLAWLSQQIPTDADVHIENMTDKICVLHLLGPDSGNLLGAVESRISGLSFMRSRQIDDFAGLKGVTATVIRVSFSGEMGYELHFPSEHGPALHTAITSNPKATSLDLKHVGSACINSMRIERGFKFRADLDLAHYKEAGIGPFLAKKRAFLGKDVEDKIPITRTSAMFQVEAEAGWEWSVIGDSPIYRKRDNKLVGYTTTSARGAATGKTVAIGYTMTDAFDQSTEAHEALELNTFGFRFPVKFLAEPLGGVNRDVWVAESAAL